MITVCVQQHKIVKTINLPYHVVRHQINDKYSTAKCKFKVCLFETLLETENPFQTIVT